MIELFSNGLLCNAFVDIRSKIGERQFINFMTIETTVLDFKLSNTFEEYKAHMKAPEQQAMFNEMGVKIFFLGQSFDNPTRATVIFQGAKNVLYELSTFNRMLFFWNDSF